MGIKYKAIDLGLPSGRLWADRNIGAEKETDYGLYFQWGDVVGYADASHSTWETCPGNGGNSTYNADSIAAWNADNLSGRLLKPEVDAATVNMGDEWRMPTYEDCRELFNNTNHEYAVIDGVAGRKFINKADASKYIFLPFAGYAAEGSFESQGAGGDVWISSVGSGAPALAYLVDANESGCGVGASGRCGALPMRGITFKQKINMETINGKERIVTITCTEKQLSMLEFICERYSRLVMGQLDISLQDICEEAWEKLHKDRGINSSEWSEMREKLNEQIKSMEKDYWGLVGGEYNGIGYSDYADSIWDMYQVMRYARWNNMPEDKKEMMRITTMSNVPTQYGSLPLIQVNYKENNNNKDLKR